MTVLQNQRIYHFTEGSVVTGILPTGQFVAYRHDEVLPRGHGHSVLSAIADLNEKIEREGSIHEDPADYDADAISRVMLPEAG